MATTLRLVALILLVALTRLIPHPPNFTPILAVGLFCGTMMASAWRAVLVPVVALWLSDMVLGLHDLMWVVGIATAVSVWIGQLSKARFSNHSPIFKSLSVLANGLVASVAFFLITNFAVWESSGMYPHTAAGLMDCFVAGLPFFHNQVLSTWVYSAVLFGAWALSNQWLSAGSMTVKEQR